MELNLQDSVADRRNNEDAGQVLLFSMRCPSQLEEHLLRQVLLP